MSAIPWTAGQLTESIAKALRARKFDAVVDFLRLLAVVDPQRAQDVLDTIEAGMMIAERGQGG